MGQILSNWRVLTATFFAVVLIIGAYMLARNTKSPPLALASAETALLQAIAARDSDGDGLPDWEDRWRGGGEGPHRAQSDCGYTSGDLLGRDVSRPRSPYAR